MAGYSIVTEQNARKGKIWNVRVYKKGLFKKLVSSDWFLDEKQASDFSRLVEEKLKDTSSVDTIETRKPGWTFDGRTR